MKMHRSSAFTVKRRLAVTIKAMQTIVESCDQEIKNTHPADTHVIKSHEQERSFATAMITKLMKQMDEAQVDLRNAID